MAFNATLEVTNDTAKITLSGELDGSSAPLFKAEVDKVGEQPVKHLVLMMQDLDYMASAGLRVIIHAVQTMRRKGGDTEIYVVSPQEMVMDTLEKTGVIQSVIVLDEYDPATIEA